MQQQLCHSTCEPKPLLQTPKLQYRMQSPEYLRSKDSKHSNLSKILQENTTLLLYSKSLGLPSTMQQQLTTALTKFILAHRTT